MSFTMRICGLAALAGVGFAAVAAADAGSVSLSELKACAAISAATDRLACYDSLAGRAASRPSTPAAAAQPPAAALATAPAAPLVATPGAAPAQPQPPAPVGTPLQTPPSAPAPPPRADTFGLYAAEHPSAPKGAESISGKIVAFGASAAGRQTVTLDGAGLWELEELDPLLKSGDSVTIQRAAFGSFLLTTPNGRTHRVRRLH
jgi:hypothetical protein